MGDFADIVLATSLLARAALQMVVANHIWLQRAWKLDLDTTHKHC